MTFPLESLVEIQNNVKEMFLMMPSTKIAEIVLLIGKRVGRAIDKKYLQTATSFFLPHQNLAKSHHLSSGAKDSKPLKYKNTDIREQNIYNYD